MPTRGLEPADYSSIFCDPGYRNAFEKYRRLAPEIIKQWCSHIIRVANSCNPENPVVLDLGCGVGRFTIPLAIALRPFNGKVIAIDNSPSMLDVLNEKISKAGIDNIQVIKADVRDFSLNVSVDVFFASEVLHVIKPIEKLLECVARSASKNSAFIVRTPSHEQLRDIAWLRFFKGAVQADIERTADVCVLVKNIKEAGFIGEAQHFNINENNSLKSSDFFLCLEQKAFSILRSLPEEEYEVGLKAIREKFSDKIDIVTLSNITCLTIWRGSVMRKPVKKSLSEISIEEAHGGSGTRQLIFHKSESFVSSQFEAMTKGFLPPGAKYDWHLHDGVDEFFLVMSGVGKIEYADGSVFDYKEGDIFYSPAGLSHQLINCGDDENIFYFIRLNP